MYFCPDLNRALSGVMLYWSVIYMSIRYADDIVVLAQARYLL